MLSKVDPVKTKSWQKLLDHFAEMKSVHMRDLFANDQRFNDFSFQFEDILIDCSKNIITEKTKQLLIGLAKECNLKDSIDKMFSGEKINETENRAVLHTALRNFSHDPIYVDDQDIMPLIRDVRKKMRIFSDAVRSGEWRGYTGKKIKNIVNIGIGGSHLGPAMVTEALKFYGSEDIKVDFISNVDGTEITEILKNLDHEETLFLIASKTFTTQETMTNAYSVREWFLRNTRDENTIKKHFIALSTNKEKVEEFGIDTENMFEFWDFIGGRYSLFSAIGLSIALYIGYDRFEEMMSGASSIDEHFKNTDFENNIPVLLALISIWYINFFGTDSEAVLPYDQYLHRFPAYLQQANMESNGKSVDREGKTLNYSTGPVIWGEPGTNGQHSFYQLIHQGTRMIPADFLVAKEPLNRINKHHKILLSNFLGQTEALMKGRTIDDIKDGTPYKVFSGNHPTNSIIYDKLTPNTLGKLIAIYEHKIFVQGIIWNIYSFDQWGVEYGKQLANIIQNEMNDGKIPESHDCSTKGLLNHLMG
ncbi:MAG: glucose-6-phosphate isomerase [Candidatus Delongbacteria bacterium]|nr:glucose-6-phosphate isomerase [Candidatus Delongbacteria bacterium]